MLTSGRFIASSETEAFEREAAVALSIAHTVGVSSGTDGLLAALMACGVGPGDEVLTTPFSFFASVGSILRLGATPVFADVDSATLNLDPTAAVRRLGPKTKAVLVVHLFGRAARIDGLEEACAARGVPIVEDAAQAIGAREGAPAVGRPVGALGRAAVLSFFPSKNLGGFGDGGMVLTTDADFAARIRVLRVHGATAKNRHEILGGNFRLDELQAALLRVKLPHLPRWTERRRQLADRYLEHMSSLASTGSIDLPPRDAGSVWNQFVIRAGQGTRDRLRQHLASRGIATAVYYPTPLHLQPALAHLGGRAGDFPHAERAAAEVLALPIYPELSLADVDRVAAAVGAFFC